MGERRGEARTRVTGAGTISLDGRRMIACRVHDLSESGVRLILTTTVGVPDTFLLHAPGYGSGVCEVAWRTDDAIGARLTRIAAW